MIEGRGSSSWQRSRYKTDRPAPLATVSGQLMLVSRPHRRLIKIGTVGVEAYDQGRGISTMRSHVLSHQ